MGIDLQMTGTVPTTAGSHSAYRKRGGSLPGRVVSISSRDASSQPTSGLVKVVAQIGRDNELLRLRAMVMCSAGYLVHSMSLDEAVKEVQNARLAQVWVFCHTLEFYDLIPLAVAIRIARPTDKLLRLTALNDIGQVPGLFDAWLDPVTGVNDLLRTVDGLAKQ
jgi:hypothetical protein